MVTKSKKFTPEILIILLVSVQVFLVSIFLTKIPQKSEGIIGGEVADISNWTFMVLILYDKNMICGGTLIRSNWVMTAARCVDKSFVGDVNIVGVRVGVDDIHSEYGRIIKNQEIVVHPDFRVDPITGVVHSDVALMMLAQKLIITESLQIVPVTMMRVRLGAECYTAGWGVDKIEVYDKGRKFVHDLFPFPHLLKQIRQTPVNHALCKGGLNPRSPDEVNMDINRHICTCVHPTDNEVHQHGPSFGDIGGPLICKGEQYGIASFSIYHEHEGEGEALHMMGWTAVSAYVSWIENIVDRPVPDKNTMQKDSMDPVNVIESRIDQLDTLLTNKLNRRKDKRKDLHVKVAKEGLKDPEDPEEVIGEKRLIEEEEENEDRDNGKVQLKAKPKERMPDLSLGLGIVNYRSSGLRKFSTFNQIFIFLYIIIFFLIKL